MQIAYRLSQIQSLSGADQLDGAFEGMITGIAALRDAEPGDLSFLGNKKYTPEVKESRASVILVPIEYQGTPKAGQCFVRVGNPSLALARICGELESQLWPWPEANIHPSAVIHETAEIGLGAHIGPGCVIEADAKIGDRSWLQAQVFVGRGVLMGERCWLRPNVTIYADCILGDRVRIHAGTVIGSDGFGYESPSGVHEKVPQIGNVVIENDVEIGANTAIDRARFSSTRIGEGAKIDNLVQIAHNVHIGPHCLIVAQAGVSGSTVLENHVVVAGQAGITGHLRLAAGTIVGAQGGIHFDTEPGKYYRGSPALEASLANRIHILSKRLPELFKRLEKIEESLLPSAH
ncbi:UDP-3-O-(3-hydroxymyristoyl)glucosamine N-acyltransferase [Cerasicoccus arenae]|uniref:UDP-3-O-acylglucosamine N-acyltransferase n=1 Tax=Cerasicoccus arenae TaxID=424488 RepID=A0A8J3DD60_9BACT|nr:UDP-3-O-(3-hydroxymyristoyl)glucosamine N-acyltransferase [Cerasicoccus arenae]MBK1859839.1 UDP-3-O-(3-hydroxymyristoyl)glucosamine N-acyltransferase [Cerasicoccus arenae]GHC08341.1 UDP-3-O-acylglucosamine N-acyltransferase [Cerasicoccus arenae]